MSSACATSATEGVAKRNYHFFPITFEIFAPISTDFISADGHRISSNTDEPRETFFLFQRLSIAIQHFNAVCFANSFATLMLKCDVTADTHLVHVVFLHIFLRSPECSTGGQYTKIIIKV